ncbi:MAG TPA: YjbE family putative metal transport protein [Aliidongia sp.]|nr:YjbE family putative metal transport protein [Aliidongia sp.]
MLSAPWIDLAQLSAFVQVVLIDITLAGDNAIVVGMAAAGLQAADRRRAILMGIAIATVLRIGFALAATEFLAVIGLTLAGGLLLLWVAWKMLREIIQERRLAHCGDKACAAAATVAPKSMRQALIQIVVADVSMSLDNVLAVAGTARFHVWVLVAGLALSVALMGAASTLVTRLLHRYPWIIWLGLGIVTYVAMAMIYDGWREVHAHLAGL